MRTIALGCALLLSTILFGQTKKFSIQFENLELEEILELVTASTGNYFSYNSDIIHEGNKFTMNVTDVTIDEFLNKLLVGTGLQHQVFENQIILRSREFSTTNVDITKTFSISGRVLDTLNMQALPGVNIFLSGTNLGGVSDMDGYYVIDNVPFGSYEVIFSHLAYDMKSVTTELFVNGTVTINIELKFKNVLLDSIEIVSKRLIGPAERRRYLNIFNDEFLGRTISSTKCEIENPEVLDFIYDPSIDKLEVFSLAPLKIINQGLGYEITYYFERFQKVGAITEFNGRVRFQGLKPESEKQKRKWIKSRKKIYLGSFLHFRRSLVNDRLKKEDFKIVLIDADDLDDIQINRGKKVSRDDLLEKVDNKTYILDFDGFLMATYKKRPEKSYVEQFFDLSGAKIQQRSLLHLSRGKVKLKDNGRMELPGISTYGYWYWERLADMLPENYDPESENL